MANNVDLAQLTNQLNSFQQNLQKLQNSTNIVEAKAQTEAKYPINRTNPQTVEDQKQTDPQNKYPVNPAKPKQSKTEPKADAVE